MVIRGNTSIVILLFPFCGRIDRRVAGSGSEASSMAPTFADMSRQSMGLHRGKAPALSADMLHYMAAAGGESRGGGEVSKSRAPFVRFLCPLSNGFIISMTADPFRRLAARLTYGQGKAPLKWRRVSGPTCTKPMVPTG